MSDLIEGFAKAEHTEVVKTFGSLDVKVQELLLAALAVRQNAYAPYSGFKVGAAFLGKENKRIFTGCNVENAAFTPTSCAERTAIATAVSEGVREFSIGAVVAYKPDVFVTPCGVCRQFIREFSSQDMPIYVAQATDDCSQEQRFNNDDSVLCTSIFNLLPNSFSTYRNQI